MESQLVQKYPFILQNLNNYNENGLCWSLIAIS